MMPGDHLSAVDVAAFIDRTMSPAARERAERHMAGCESCREELAASARLASTVPPQRRGTPWAWIGVAAAAAVVILVARPQVERRERGDPIERGHPVTTPVQVMPADLLVRRPDLRFVWRSDGTGTTYRVIVIDANGAPTWTTDLADTTVRIPASTKLSAGMKYFWRVEALHPDGGVTKSEMLSFTIAP